MGGKEVLSEAFAKRQAEDAFGLEALVEEECVWSYCQQVREGHGPGSEDVWNR